MPQAAPDTGQIRRTARNGLLVVLTSILLLVVGVASLAPRPGGEWLAFTKPTGAGVTAAADKLVFAHYFPPYPLSIDNLDPASDHYSAEYLPAAGENGIHEAYGGFLRDRPVPRIPRSGDDWREQDLATEIAQAASAGIDGFSVDILTSHDSSQWIAPIPEMLLRAAEKTNPTFRIMLMPDMTGEFSEMSPRRMADEIARLADSPAAFRLADGRLVVSPFFAESRSISWWSDFVSAMKTAHGIDVALVPLFLDPTNDNIANFAPISYGMSAWGSRSPSNSPVDGFPLETIGQAHGRHLLWMQSVALQDYRPRDEIFDEPENTTNFRNTWQIAMNGGAEWVQIVTWNDYSENTEVAPTMRDGDSVLQLIAFYSAYFKGGRPPTILADKVFLTHRTQLIAARPDRQTALARLRDRSSPGRDAVEALAFLTAPAQVRLRVGDEVTVCDAPAGVSTCLAPVQQPTPEGSAVSVDVVRDQSTVVTLTSPSRIVADPSRQDLSYVVSQSQARIPASSSPARQQDNGAWFVAAACAAAKGGNAVAATPSRATVRCSGDS